MADTNRRLVYVTLDRDAPPRGALEQAGYAVVVERTVRGALDRLIGDEVAGVVTEDRTPSESVVEFLRTLRSRRPDVPVVVYARDGDESLAAETVAAGATEYVPAGTEGAAERLVDRVGAALDASEARADRRIPEALKERAMDEAPVGITVADMRLPDEPLIYVNEAFERLTGYPVEWTLGRNCRFLQGEDTDEGTVATMRAAIDAERPVSVELRNYRRDGEPFWNRVDLAPVADEHGEVTHYVGFQTDVTDRRRAERAAERRAADLERLVERIDGLVGDVTETLVEATSRAEVERRVCECVVTTDLYEFAWIGRRSIGDGTVDPTAASPGDGAGDDLAADDLVVAAVETGEIQSAGGVPDAVADEAGIVGGARAAIPLVYRETLYGVLTVYADDSEAFDRHEVAVLSALGRAIGTAINAVTTQRLLSASEVVELGLALRDRECFFVDLSERLGCRLEYVGSVQRPDGLLLFFTAEGTTPEAVREAVATADRPATVDHLTGAPEGPYEFAVSSSPLLDVLTTHGGEIRSIAAEDGRVRVTVEVADRSDARAVADALKGRDPSTSVEVVRNHERPSRTRREFVDALEERLTDQQITALRKAYVSGYFEWPRDTDGPYLADSMGITRSTFHQHLRAALRKLAAEFHER